MIYEISRNAQKEIDDIAAYTVAEFGAVQADTYLDGLFYSFDLLTDNPNMGQSFDKTRRRFLYKRHYVYYRIRGQKITIAAVRNTSTKQPNPRR